MLKRVFQKFVESKCGPLNKQGSWEGMYRILDDRCEELYGEKSFTIALRDDNIVRNRYSNVFPFDDNRVLLRDVENDYINASFMRYPDINTTYICSQGPLRETVEHFWLMVHQQKCKIIIMLNNLQEKGRDKCYKYYPDIEGQIIKTHKMAVKFKYAHQITKNIIKRTLDLHHLPSDSRHEIVQYHFTSWPDFGVPDTPIDFLTLINEVNKSSHAVSAPVIIHCSAGLGRTGTYCLTDSVLKKMKKSQHYEIDIFEHLVSMRQFRFGLIQTSEQLYFAYISICADIDNLPGLKDPEPIAAVSGVAASSMDRSTSLSKRVTPLSKRAVPLSEQTPLTEQTSPLSERAAPLSERVAPHSERVAPHSERVAPHSERGALQSEQMTPLTGRATPLSERATPERRSVDKSAATDKTNKISTRKQVVKSSYRKTKSQSTSSVSERSSPASARSRRTVSTNQIKQPGTPKLKTLTPRNTKHKTKK